MVGAAHSTQLEVGCADMGLSLGSSGGNGRRVSESGQDLFRDGVW